MVTTVQKNNIASYFFGQRGSVSTIVPQTFYIGLSTTQMSADGSLSGEISGKGYSRVEIANDSNSFGTAENGVVKNNIRIEYGEATEDWGIVKTVFIANASTGGSVLYYAHVDRNVPSGATLYFDIGGLQFSVTS